MSYFLPCYQELTQELIGPSPASLSYWNANSNNWDFDYDSYYATYGYPQPGAYDAAYAAQASEQASAYGGGGPSAGPSSGPSSSTMNGGTYSGASTSNAKSGGAGGADEKTKYVPGPKDADGNPLAGHLKKGETRTTVLRKSVGKLYEDPTLLEWDPSECDALLLISVEKAKADEWRNDSSQAFIRGRLG